MGARVPWRTLFASSVTGACGTTEAACLESERWSKPQKSGFFLVNRFGSKFQDRLSIRPTSKMYRQFCGIFHGYRSNTEFTVYGFLIEFQCSKIVLGVTWNAQFKNLS